MRSPRLSPPAWLALVGTLGLACTPPEEPFPNAEELSTLRELHTPTRAPPQDDTNKYAGDPRAISLGSKLFVDPKLSACGTVSCSSCHQGEGMTVDGAKAQGCGGSYTGRNPPTVLNSGYNDWFMWDGRSDRLWNQALLPLTSPIEMGSSAAILRSRLSEAYLDDYSSLFGQPPSAQPDDLMLANFGKAVAAYERTLNRIDAPFDQDVIRFLRAVDAGTEKQDPAYLGLKTFVRTAQCASCHKGPMLNDDKFHNIGVKDASDGNHGVLAGGETVLASRFNAAGAYSDKSNGEAANRLQAMRSDLVQKRDELEGAFKTSSLRNIALTAPYMHTGELATLEDVVDLYNKGGEKTGNYVGVVSSTIKARNLSDAEKKALVELLKSLTGAAPAP